MHTVIERVLGPLARRWAWVRTALRVQERFGEVHGSYLASAVTLTAFLSLFPLLLVAVAVLGFVAAGHADLPSRIISNLGLTGDAARLVTDSITRAEKTRGTALGVGTAGLLWSGLGLVAALQVAFNAVWQVPSRGLKDKLYGLAWLGGAGLIMAASFALTAAVNFLPGVLAPVAFVVAFAVNLALWLWSMKVLQNRSVDWKSLLPGAVVGAVGLEVLKAVGAIYVPRVVSSSSALYGSIGIVFAVLAWLLFFGRLVVYSTVVNVVRWEEDHGTVTAEIELPRLPGEVPVTATRAGEAVDIEPAQAS
ncbi:MAG: rane protein [Actinomycetota bacterium]|nr:rane protein [Actinomycetota bacterium]